MSGCGRKHRAKFLTRQFLNPTAWSALEPNEQLGICVEAPNGGQVRLLLLFPLHLPREKWSLQKGVETSPLSPSPSCGVSSTVCVTGHLEVNGRNEVASPILMESDAKKGIQDHKKDVLSPTNKDARRSGSTAREITQSTDNRDHFFSSSSMACNAPGFSTSPSASGDASVDSNSLPMKEEEECRTVTTATTSTVHAVATSVSYGYMKDVGLPRKFHKVIWLAVKDVVVVVNEEEMKMKLSPDQLKYYMKQPQYILYYKQALEESMKMISQMRKDTVLQVPHSKTSLFTSSSSTECVSSPSLAQKEKQNRQDLVENINNSKDSNDEVEEEEHSLAMVNANRRPHHRMYIYGDDEEEEGEEEENDEV